MALTAPVLKEIAFTYDIFLDTFFRGVYQNSKKMWKIGHK